MGLRSRYGGDRALRCRADQLYACRAHIGGRQDWQQVGRFGTGVGIKGFVMLSSLAHRDWVLLWYVVGSRHGLCLVQKVRATNGSQEQSSLVESGALFLLKEGRATHGSPELRW